jgi:hypothetical protein
MPQLVVTPVHDSYYDYGSPNTNYGASTSILMGVVIAGGIKTQVLRAIANFDVSAIPSSAVIAQAKMQRALTLVDPRSHTVKIDRCTRPAQWTENGVTWNKYDGVTPWTFQGGDFDEGTPPAISFLEAMAAGQHEVTGLGGFVRDALDLHNGIVSLIMRNENEGPAQTEHSAWLAGALWKLIIDYDVTGDPGRRSVSIKGPGRRPTAPSTASTGSQPSRPSEGRRS